MSSEEEDKYFKQRDMEKIAEARREQQLEAIRQQEREGVQDVLQSSDEVAAEALALGFDSETARVLPLVPLIQMAWADGSVTTAENEKVLELAYRFGIEREGPAHNFLTLLLGEQPSDVFFERVDRVIAHLVEEQPNYWQDKSVVDLAREVAEASGGFFKLTSPINGDEKKLLDRFAELFSVQERSAGDVIQGEEG
ncbi:hypothetical protein FIV42_22345 [Persicimonas caeni]|uniref:TerB family tellurite resistance protein n=1 Tax=Persicimonas caeni TaxID=2292766 RepID=A0A4Y6PYP8_PERCE|nr:hypothetical protein [Persicimonas caeni]QDG53383.1 hypothetical protein FIV42_22345 [Persicimonas caeni]QED34604.1 hypothetical protein FRD00_22340 [Persicimonas caeni]